MFQETSITSPADTIDLKDSYKLNESKKLQLYGALTSSQTGSEATIKLVSRLNSASIDTNPQSRYKGSSTPISEKLPMAQASQHISAGILSRSSGVSTSGSSRRALPKLEAVRAQDDLEMIGDDDKSSQSTAITVALAKGTSCYDPRRMIRPDYEGAIRELKYRLNRATKDAQGWKRGAMELRAESQT